MITDGLTRYVLPWCWGKRTLKDKNMIQTQKHHRTSHRCTNITRHTDVAKYDRRKDINRHHQTSNWCTYSTWQLTDIQTTPDITDGHATPKKTTPSSTHILHSLCQGIPVISSVHRKKTKCVGLTAKHTTPCVFCFKTESATTNLLLTSPASDHVNNRGTW